MRKNKKNKGVVDTVLNLIIITGCLGIALFATGTVAIMTSNGGSMEPTYMGSVTTFEVGANLFGIERGDIVTATFLISGEDEKVGKRVIGLPGEHVYWDGSNVYINGELLIEDSYETNPMGEYTEFEREKSVQLGDDEYFLMGDNRPSSIDSRDLGAIKGSDIKYKTIFTIKR